MNPILSQDEIDALLSALDRGEIPEPYTVVEERPAERTVIRYNFRRPNRVSKDQIKLLQSIHETFARLYTSSLTTMLRGLVEVAAGFPTLYTRLFRRGRPRAPAAPGARPTTRPSAPG